MHWSLLAWSLMFPDPASCFWKPDSLLLWVSFFFIDFEAFCPERTGLDPSGIEFWRRGRGKEVIVLGVLSRVCEYWEGNRFGRLEAREAGREIVNEKLDENTQKSARLQGQGGGIEGWSKSLDNGSIPLLRFRRTCHPIQGCKTCARILKSKQQRNILFLFGDERGNDVGENEVDQNCVRVSVLYILSCLGPVRRFFVWKRSPGLRWLLPFWRKARARRDPQGDSFDIKVIENSFVEDTPIKFSTRSDVWPME